jgi:hypothetical protein
MKLISIFVFVLALSACGHFLPPEHETTLSNKANCCNSFESLPYQTIEFKKPIRTLVGPNSPTFNFTQGKSFFAAISLPTLGANSALTIRTYPLNMTPNVNGHVFVPRITFLTTQYAVISSISPDFYVQSPRFGIGESSWRVDQKVPVGSAFVVIHTSQQERNKPMRMRDTDQRSGYLYTRTGPAGEIEIELQ